jgi:pyruvate ferredoxin oxidoreductase beta subunit
LINYNPIFESGHDFIYVCIGNETFVNQETKSLEQLFMMPTPTTPAGKFSFGNLRPKKDMSSIIAAYSSLYIATTSICFSRV